jgi:CDP-diacylglycerol--glycerol-3-phosphate 3-phosphatidyltransferase
LASAAAADPRKFTGRKPHVSTDLADAPALGTLGVRTLIPTEARVVHRGSTTLALIDTPALPSVRVIAAAENVSADKASAGKAAAEKPRRRQHLGLYALKPWYTRRLTPIIDIAVARKISPDLFTLAGVVAGGAAGVAIAFGWWPLVALFLALRLAGANLDGAVARAAGVSRPWGFVVNEVGDRTSDLLAFAGLAVWAARQRGPGLHFQSWPVIMVLVAALAASLPTFASLAAAGAGATRRNGGPLGKTERCLFMVLATVFPIILPVVTTQLINGSLITTVLRLRAAHRELVAQRQPFDTAEQLEAAT